jgi:hypothetical protein
LHRRDRDDATGERAATFALPASLRGLLSAASVPEGVRPAAEAALEVEATDALVREAYDDARALVALTPAAEDAGVRRRLTVVGGFLDAQAGDYAGAADAMASAAAATPEGGEAGELLALAEAFALRAGSGRHAGAASAQAGAAAAQAAVAALQEARLGVAPNPAGGPATATLALAAPGVVRLAVYDVLGREVARLADGPLGTGRHAYVLDGAALAPGAYVLRAVVEAEPGAARGALRTLVTRLTITR